jgi:hypothetical protein
VIKTRKSSSQPMGEVDALQSLTSGRSLPKGARDESQDRSLALKDREDKAVVRRNEFSFSARPALVQRNRSVIVSREFPSSSPYRSFPMLVQLGHFSAPKTREQSFNRVRWLSWLKGS